MYGPSDMYGDLSLEDVEEFEGLEPEDGREIAPEGRFQRDEVRNFEKDFEYELEQAQEEEFWCEDEVVRSAFESDDSAMEQDLQELYEDEEE